MNDVDIPLLFNGPHIYRMELVEVETDANGVLSYNTVESTLSYGATRNSTFAHILGGLRSEELYPGDIVSMFFSDAFDVRLVGEYEVFVKQSPFWDHYREELLRLSGGCYTIEELWSYPFHVDDWGFQPPCYGRSIEEEEDTLNSEELLTEQYVGPEKPLAVDSVSDTTIRPQRRVVAIQPIEQED